MENLGIDWKLLIAQLINFALFFFLFARYVAKPFAKFVREQKKMQEEKEHALSELKQAEEKVQKQQQVVLKKAETEAEMIITSAKQDAKQVRAELIEEAQKEAREIKEKAKKGLDQDRQEMARREKDKVVDMAFFIVKNALGDVLDEEAKKKVTAKILKSSARDMKMYEN